MRSTLSYCEMLLMLFGVGGIGGCGASPRGSSDDPQINSDITPALRAACADWAINDVEIDAMIFGLEAYLDDGYTLAQARGGAENDCVAACEDRVDPCGLACLTCNYAVVEFLYEDYVPPDRPEDGTEAAVLYDCNQGNELIFSEGQVGTLIDAFTIEMDDGVSYSDSFDSLDGLCDEVWPGTEFDDENRDCVLCGRAAVNYVYGR